MIAFNVNTRRVSHHCTIWHFGRLSAGVRDRRTGETILRCRPQDVCLVNHQKPSVNISLLNTNGRVVVAAKCTQINLQLRLITLIHITENVSVSDWECSVTWRRFCKSTWNCSKPFYFNNVMHFRTVKVVSTWQVFEGEGLGDMSRKALNMHGGFVYSKRTCIK